LIKAGREILGSETHELINYIWNLEFGIWNKEELPYQWKKYISIPIYKKGDKTDSGDISAISALRRKQREQLESNHRENKAMRNEGETDQKSHKHSPWKRRNGDTPLGYSG
jgi:hypothetical protein